MDKYCMYLRKSRADAETQPHGEGETLKRHEMILKNLANKMNLKIEAVYKEIVSGETICARPVMQKLLNEIEQNIWSGVFVMEIERLARGNTIDQGIVAQAFKFSGTKIITPLKTYNPCNEFDEEYFEFGLFMSRREYKTINRRLQKGREISAKEGKYVASCAPYGYEKKKIAGDKGYTLEPLKEEAQIVKLIFSLYTSGSFSDSLSAEKIASKLNLMGISSKKGGKWCSSAVRDILINPVYTGKIRWNWRPQSKKIINGELKIVRARSKKENVLLASGIHTPIIKQDIFDRAQRIMKSKSHLPLGKSKTVKNPLAGIAVCGKCGKKMVRRAQKNKCERLVCVSKSCSNTDINLKSVENKIIENLSQKIKTPLLNCGEKEISKGVKASALKKIEKEIKKTEFQIQRLRDLLEQKIYSPKIYFERFEVNAEKLKLLKNEKTAFEENLREASNKMARISEINKSNLKQIYEKLETPKEKNDFLRRFVKKIVCTKIAGQSLNDNFEFTIFQNEN